VLTLNIEDDTNSNNLELYSIMGEYDNAGFPLSYCLLSTATALDIGKWKKALSAWAECLRDTYGVISVFAHTDKDMGEIGMLQDVWSAKIQLCWWHLQKAVRERLSKSKLSTSPYNTIRARSEFAFIDVAFVPVSKADPHEYEGGAHDATITIDEPPRPSPNTISLHIKHIPSSLWASSDSSSSTIPPSLPATMPHLEPIPAPKVTAPNTSVGERLVIKLKPLAGTGGSSTGVLKQDVSTETAGRQEFCPEELRKPIIDMVETHFCAHPLIPGYSHPSPEGIREWAVKQIYQFCVRHDLREVWAYLWENWYRPGRWELWARSYHPEIPILKTTMILESQ
jgi:hypothetical protein